MDRTPIKEISQEEIRKVTKEAKKTIRIRGLHIGELSPYDVPQKAGAAYDENSKTFTVFFNYLTPDEPTHDQKGNAITLKIGKNTGKLYGIVVSDCEKTNIPDIRVEVTNIIARAVKKAEEDNKLVPAMNLALAQKILEKDKNIYPW